jgi:hypothetical protein
MNGMSQMTEGRAGRQLAALGERQCCTGFADWLAETWWSRDWEKSDIGECPGRNCPARRRLKHPWLCLFTATMKLGSSSVPFSLGTSSGVTGIFTFSWEGSIMSNMNHYSRHQSMYGSLLAKHRSRPKKCQLTIGAPLLRRNIF